MIVHEGLRRIAPDLIRGAPPRSRRPRVQLLGSGTILNEVLAAGDLLAEDFGVHADIWSVTSFTELRRFFAVDRHYVAVAALKELADTGEVEPSVVAEAIKRCDIDPEAPMPTTI